MKMLRTTIRLDASLLRETKKLAADTGRTVTAVIEDALREVVGRREQRASINRFKLPTFRGDGVRPGVDLDDSAGLMDRIDEVER